MASLKENIISACILICFFSVVIGLAASGYALFGSQVSIDQAQEVARQQLSKDAVVESKDVWFVGTKGCDRSDNVIFSVKPYVSMTGVQVNNAIICGGWPFKALTPRFK